MNNRGGLGQAGRGRGRGKTYGRDGEEGQDDGWNKGGDKDGELWDDVPEGSGGGGSSTRTANSAFDLADFAAAALQFQSNTRGMGLTEAAEQEIAHRVAEEDPIERLFREQSNAAEDGLLADVPVADDEDEGLPDWADEDDRVVLTTTRSAGGPNTSSDSKRSLLLEVIQFVILTHDRTHTCMHACMYFL